MPYRKIVLLKTEIQKQEQKTEIITKKLKRNNKQANRIHNIKL